MKKSRLILLFLFFLGGSLKCDNPFATRIPEDPTGGQQSLWIPPNRASIVLFNLENAFFERNVENYIRCFVDSTFSERSFRLVPDQNVINIFPGTFDTWSISDERNYITQLFKFIPEDGKSQLTFSDTTRLEADTVVFIRDYELVVEHTLNRADLPTEFRGEAEFYLANINGEWAIYHWIDRNTQEGLTWSFLKAAFQ